MGKNTIELTSEELLTLLAWGTEVCWETATTKEVALTEKLADAISEREADDKTTQAINAIVEGTK